MSDYFVAINGMQQGPFPMRELLARGMRPESLVWREGMAEWQRADSLPDLAALFAPPAAAPAPPLASHPSPRPMTESPYGAPYSHSGPRGVEYQHPTFNPPTSGAAIASLILGIFALVPCIGWLIVPSAILAVALGSAARGAVRRGEATGGGMALAGIICGTISLCIIALGIFFFAFVGMRHGSRFFRF